VEIEVTEETLPGVGMRYEFGLGGGERLVVTAERHGRRSIAVRAAEDADPAWSVTLQQQEAVTLAALLLGARFTTAAPPEPAEAPGDDGRSDEVLVRSVVLTDTSPLIGLTPAEIRLPRPDAVAVAVHSAATPAIVEDERTHRCRPGDSVVLLARASVADAVARYVRSGG
jgi:hypothetical protein